MCLFIQKAEDLRNYGIGVIELYREIMGKMLNTCSRSYKKKMKMEI